MKVAQVTPGLIPIPPNGWGAVEKIIWEYKQNLDRMGIQTDIKYLNEVIPNEYDIVHIHMNTKSGVIAWAAKKSGIKHIIIHSHADLKFRGSLISKVVGTLELLFQKQLMSMSANYFWGCYTNLSIHICSIHIYLPPAMMNSICYFNYI